MPSNRWSESSKLLPRRSVLAAGAGCAAWPWVAAAQGAVDIPALVQQGGLVVAMRHATAPGTFDPPGFRLGDCSTQRNLSEEGRSQARRAGQWFAQRGLRPAAVRSSPWCRCVDTATLAFGPPEVWAALGSPHGAPETTGAAHLKELRAALEKASTRKGQFEVWVTHMFVLQDLAGTNTASAEALLLRAEPESEVRVIARLPAS
ncbi:histidine phosphatase family protein [Acidovorax sp. DW039]|uniref:histidine phosphatase family protein n=1 Tax=Acidovorax sp. DW039 TaxID=3095606 RepID=UPI0030850A05|nr:histidine phosphatase family protein [Acidovorax sp. DW039]